MTTQLYKAVVVLDAVSGMAEDDCQNVFYFEGQDALQTTAEDVSNIAVLLTSFYNDIPGALSTDLASFIGEQINRAANACSVLVYQHPAGNPAGDWGSPAGVQSMTLDAATAGTPYPAEVAAVLSFHGDLTNIPETQANPSPPPAVIRPAARHRGRIFLGPLQSATGVEDGTTHEPLPGNTFRNVLAGAAQTLMDDAPTLDMEWVVASVTADATYPIVGGWVDYAFDTQRRRGQAPVARQVWP